MKKMVKEIGEQFKKVTKSGTVREMIINIPLSFPEFLIFIFMFMLMMLPAYELIRRLLVSENYYFLNLSALSQITAFIGIFSVVIIAAKQVIEKKERLIFINKPVIFFGFTVLMMVMSTFANGFNKYAVHGDSYRGESLFTFIVYFVIYFYCGSMIKNQKLKALLLYAYVFSADLLSVVSVVHIISPISLFADNPGLSMVFSNYNHMGYYILMGITISSVLSVKEENTGLKIFSFISFSLNTAILIVNDTFGCYLACIFALIFSVVVISVCEKKLNKLSIMMIALFIVITLSVSIFRSSVTSNFIELQEDISDIFEESDDAGSAGSGRWRLWCCTAEYISEKPLLGYGVEGIGERLRNETGIDRPHCEFLQYAAFFGIPAAISYVCGALSVYFNGLNKKYELDKYTIAALVSAFAYLASSAFGNTMYYTAPYFFMLLGIGFSQNEAIGKIKKQPKKVS